MLCCKSYLPLGCFYSCECIILGILAEEDGDHLFEYTYGGTMHIATLAGVVTGEPLRLPFALNENSAILFRILQPNGDYLNYQGYECFSLTISPELNHGTANYDDDCPKDDAPLNSQNNYTEIFILTQDLANSAVNYKTIVIGLDHTPVVPIRAYKAIINGLLINVPENGTFTVYLSSGNYPILILPLSDYGTFNLVYENIILA